ncbi:hypothetical protein NM688_g2586 [Phlebia brevispora]|uniref:Uncharacterized protein n=1 Tax=Phlebia brevispora TaxID=194682 RepID=A0ACC1T858_9APHY|nr:hypothetical protein NM688_g2586 [Phlebia brevispora]
MRPPTRTTRSTRQLLDAQEPASPARRSANSKIALKAISRAASKPDVVPDKKPRHRMTDRQLERLEALYQQDTHPSREQKQALGEEVGMDTRTVTVWFQNRRQLAKKQSLILGSTPQPMCRQPLRAMSQAHSQSTSRQPSVSSGSQSSAPQTPLFYSSSRQQPKRPELWEHLPSSPVTSTTVSAATSALPSPLAKRFPNIFGQLCDRSKEKIEGKKRKPILEWACARVAKRQRLQPPLEDDEKTEDDADFDVTLVDLESEQENVKPMEGKEFGALRKKTSVSLSKRKIISIPAEYTKDFSPDVVLGASLLLTFQQSYKSPNVSANKELQ